MKDLYGVRTIVKEYRGCKDVAFNWFCCDPRERRDYASLIRDFDPMESQYEEDAINELFTEAEANQLKEYLDRVHGDDGITTIVKINLPLGECVGFGAMAVGGNDDFYMLNEEPEYDLPFKVWGYYNLIDCELIDEPGKQFRHRLDIVTRDGDGKIGARRETQKEVREREDKFALRNEAAK